MTSNWVLQKGWNENRVTLVHYALFAVIYSIYGRHICPILNSLHFGSVIGPAVVTLCAQWVLRAFLLNQVCPRTDICPLKLRFRVDFAAFLAAGIALSTFNRMYFNVPLENVAKVFTAFVALGFYITVDLALRREREMARAAHREGSGVALTKNFTPVTRKFLTFSIVNLAILTTIVMLVTYKDLLYLGSKRGAGSDVFVAIFVELAFTVSVLSAYVARVVHQYSRTMNVGIACSNPLK